MQYVCVTVDLSVHGTRKSLEIFDYFASSFLIFSDDGIVARASVAIGLTPQTKFEYKYTHFHSIKYFLKYCSDSLCAFSLLAHSSFKRHIK